MIWYPDLGSESPMISGPRIRAVGWLDAAQPYSAGAVSPVVLSKLKRLCVTWLDSARVLRWPEAAKGRVTCPFCGARGLRGAFGVPGDEVLYVVSERIWHHCQEHAYQPARELADAVLRCPEFITKAYASRVRDFIGAPVVERFRPSTRARLPERRR